MNKKLIALAVSAAVAAPVATQAADVAVYGRINNAIDVTNVDGMDSTTDLSTVGSRFGIKASSDLGNGLTASARYEFATITDIELNNIDDLRIGTVGISGGFGSVTVGNQWSAFSQTVGTHIDPTYTLGAYVYSGVAQGAYRASNTIKYTNSFGPVSLNIDVRVNGSDEGTSVAEALNGDGGGIGLSINPVSGLTLALALDREDDGNTLGYTKRTGLAAKWSAPSGFYAIVGYQEAENNSTDADNKSIYVGTDFGGGSTNLMVGLQSATNNGNDASQRILGIYHNMGGGLRLYYEGTTVDYDAGLNLGNDLTRHLLGMRYDF